MKKEYTRPQVIIVEFKHQELMQQSSPRVYAVQSNLPSGDVFELGGENGDGDDEDYEGDIR